MDYFWTLFDYKIHQKEELLLGLVNTETEVSHTISSLFRFGELFLDPFAYKVNQKLEFLFVYKGGLPGY